MSATGITSGKAKKSKTLLPNIQAAGEARQPVLDVETTGATAKSGKQLLTSAEFAEALDIHPATVRQWVYRRRLAHYRIGGLVRIPRSELERIQRQAYVPPRPEAAL